MSDTVYLVGDVNVQIDPETPVVDANIADVTINNGNLPSGGKYGDLLIKQSDRNFDAEWESVDDAGFRHIYYDSTDNWSAKASTVSEEGTIYIYSDYAYESGADIPGIKIGDGTTVLSDLPFIGQDVAHQVLVNSGLIDTLERNFTATVTDSYVAPKNLFTGDLVIVRGILYKITANVLKNAALVVGTNITRTSIETILGAIDLRPYTYSPADLGSPSPGSSIMYARGDHVHRKPTASEIGAYVKPSGGIPASDLNEEVQESLGKADAALPKAGGTMTGAIAMGSNKITGLAEGTEDGDAVNLQQMASAISQSAAYFRGSFATKADLLAVQWQTSNPDAANYVTNNDYAIVQADESHNNECWRYIYVSGTGWDDQYKINNTPLTQAQLDAINSGANATNIGSIADKYVKPSGGIPKSDLASGVQSSLDSADSAYQKPSGGIPATDMTDAVQTSLGKADSAYQKPSGGIPASDIADGVVPSAYTSNPEPLGTADPGSSGSWAKGDHVHAMPSASDVGAPLDDSITATVLTSLIAPKNLVSGDWVIFEGVLYRVTTNVTNGETLAVGTNIAATTVEERVAAVKVSPYSSLPAALGTANAGTSPYYSRGDHVHAKPTYTKTEIGLGNVDNVRQYSATNPPPYPVTSVNGATGAVVIAVPSSPEDIGAASDDDLALTESAMVATRNYPKGSLLVAVGQLYKATTSIANGETLVVGTNIAATSVSDELDYLDEKNADTDGTYPDMTVGSAERLIATVAVEDNAPYLFRTSGGSAEITDREVDELVGGTVAWNQICPNANFNGGQFPYNATKTYDSGTDSIELTGTIPAGSYAYLAKNGLSTKANHIYFISCNVSSVSGITAVWLKPDGAASTPTAVTFVSGSHNYANLQKASASPSGCILGLSAPQGTEFSATFSKVMLIDMTQMFGATIAEYVLSLETATPGAGVAWFRKLFPKDYYAYDAGTLMSVKTSAHKMVEFNAWDEEWESGKIDSTTGENEPWGNGIRSKNYIGILPNTNYYCKSPATLGLRYYDADKNYIGSASVTNAVITTPSNAYYLRFVIGITSYSNNICINLSWDGSRDGEYEPYEAHTYALDGNLELRGIPKLDADNKLYFDGDTYEADGTVTRRYGIINLGTLTWDVENASIGQFYINNANTQITPNMKFHGNLVCVKYLNNPNGSYNNLSSGQISATNGQANVILRVVDSAYINATAAAFKTAMNGVYLVYELATPATESADPYTNPQVVSRWGTEEYIDSRSVPVPVGHNTQYEVDLQAKLEAVPYSPDGDGDYILRQNHGENKYTPLIFPTYTASDVGAVASNQGVANSGKFLKVDIDGSVIAVDLPVYNGGVS